MRTNPNPPPSLKRKRENDLSGSGAGQADSPSARPSTRRRAAPASGPVLKRSDSFPALLPSQILPRSQRLPGAEVQPKRYAITRAESDAHPPMNFTTDGDVHAGSLRKDAAANLAPNTYAHYEDRIKNNPEFKEIKDIVYASRPDFDLKPEAEKKLVLKELINHPKFRAEFAKARNEEGAIPNRATAFRMMDPYEQKFLTLAFREVDADVRKNPFHIHGESSIVGDKEGNLTWMKHYPDSEAKVMIRRGDRYHLHTHPPLMEPLTSSASGADHIAASAMYRFRDNHMSAYVTNGKDVLHIQPDSTELVRLIPDPFINQIFGPFPVAFKLPDPQWPPHPFDNHEAP